MTMYLHPTSSSEYGKLLCTLERDPDRVYALAVTGLEIFANITVQVTSVTSVDFVRMTRTSYPVVVLSWTSSSCKRMVAFGECYLFLVHRAQNFQS